MAEDWGTVDALRQAAQALDRAGHFESEQTIAGDAQRSVPPSAAQGRRRPTPLRDTCPAAQYLDVGGDWLDAPCSDGSPPRRRRRRVRACRQRRAGPDANVIRASRSNAYVRRRRSRDSTGLPRTPHTPFAMVVRRPRRGEGRVPTVICRASAAGDGILTGASPLARDGNPLEVPAGDHRTRQAAFSSFIRTVPSSRRG
jgi:hypothetical protein